MGSASPRCPCRPGSGQSLADRFDIGLDDYHVYCGIAAQLVGVNVAAAGAAYRRLVEDPDLRRRMGEAGRARARADFDWSAIMTRYEGLWDDLAERRHAGAASAAARTWRPRPDRMDPFRVFASYPSAIIAPDTALRLMPGAGLADAVQRRALASVAFAEMFLPAPDLVADVLSALPPDGWLAFDTLRGHLPRHAPLSLAAGVVWLAKLGVLETGPSDASRFG